MKTSVTCRLRCLSAVTVALALLASCSVSTPRREAAGGVQQLVTEGGEERAQFDDGISADELASPGEEGATGEAPAAAGSGGAPDVTSQSSAGATRGGASSGSSGAGVGTGSDAGGGSTSAQPSGGRPPVVGVTNTSITMSVSLASSGIYGPFHQQYFNEGVQTWVDEVNEAGGIHGRKIVVKKVDNKNTPDGAIGACKEASSNGSFIVFQLRGDDSEMDCLEKSGVNFVQAGGLARGTRTWKRGREIANVSSIATLLPQYVKGPLGRADRPMGLMYVDTFAWADPHKAFLDSANANGLRVVGVEKVAPNQGSFTAELARLRSAGAETVALLVGLEAIGILRDARAIGYTATFTGVHWLVDEASTAGSDVLAGVRGLRHFATTDTPQYVEYAKKAAKYRGVDNPSSTSMYMYANIRLVGAALRAAGPDLDDASLQAGFDSITDYNDGILPPVTWSGRLLATEGAFPVECCNPNRTWKAAGSARTRF